VLDFGFVTALRSAGARLRYADRETRDAFADGVADVIKNDSRSGKLTHEYDKLIAGLEKDKINTDDVLLKIDMASKKDAAAADEVRDWLKAKKNASDETAEQAKNYVNWVRFGDGKYKGALIKMVRERARAMADISPNMDADEIEASMTSNYFVEVSADGYKQLKESPWPGAYIGWLKKYFSRRAGVYPREKQTHLPAKTSLDVEYEGDEGEEETTPAAYVTEEDIGRYHDFDPDEPDAKELLENLERFIKTKEPVHGKNIVMFLRQLIENRAWKLTSDIVQKDFDFAKKLYDVNPRHSPAKLERDTKGMTPEKKKEHVILEAQMYAYKTLFPHLVLAVTDYMKTHGKATDLITLKNALLTVRKSWFQEHALEKLKGVPGYVLEEVPEYAIEERPVKTKKVDKETGKVEEVEEGKTEEVDVTKSRKKYRKVSSTLSAQLLRRAAVEDIDLVGVLMMPASAPMIASENEHPGVIWVFERSTPEQAHQVTYRYSADGRPVFDVPQDSDTEHIAAVMVAAEKAHEDETGRCLCQKCGHGIPHPECKCSDCACGRPSSDTKVSGY
jgi:hypothetical protein